MRDYTVIYTLSSVRDLIRDILLSLESLTKFIPKEKISIIFTEPIDYNDYDKLNEYNIMFTDNITDEFFFQKSRGYIRGGEKIQLCYANTENVIFLDCDTIIKKDISELLNGEYDFYARPEYSAMRDFEMDIWKNMLESFGCINTIPMFNTGFMIFKNYIHKKIYDDWLKYFNMDLPQCHPRSYQKEQYALSIAIGVGNYSIKYMDKNEHAFRWDFEENEDTYVLHGTIRKRPLMFKTKRMIKDILRKLGLLRMFYK